MLQFVCSLLWTLLLLGGSAAAAASPYAWGGNFMGQLGYDTGTLRSTPVPLGTLSGVVAVAGGFGHTLALLTDGTVRAEGTNTEGQLGGGANPGPRPVTVSGLDTVVAIAAGGWHSLALHADGTVRAWGQNGEGELGDGTTTNRSTPVPVSGLSGVVAIAASGYHSLALRADGTVHAWGLNSHGQLGDGTTTNRTTPVPVSGLHGVVAVVAGGYHSLALLADGTVRTWGYNAFGQLGDGTLTDQSTPVPVSGLRGVVALAGGYYHNLALLADGTVWAWEANGSGQPGEALPPSLVPVNGLSSVVAIAAGVFHNLALLADGTVHAWGGNPWGQLGDGTTTNRSTPLPVTGLSGVVAIAAGQQHSLALTPDGPQVLLGVNQAALHTGSAHTARATLLPGPTPPAANVFLALQLPDASLLYLRGDGTLTPTGEAIAAVAPVPTYTGQVFQHTFTGTEPAGTYRWLGALADPTTGAFLGPLAETPFTVNPPATGPLITLAPNHAFLRPGQRHTLQVTLAAGEVSLTADVYLALRLPTGELRFLSDAGALSISPMPYHASWAGEPASWRVFQYDFTGGEPAGTYTWLAGFAEPGTMTFLGPILSAPFSFAP
jgi:alpha-tubulin suppressor-like RCC1 family protein